MVFLQFFLLIIFSCLPESRLSLNFTGKCSKELPPGPLLFRCPWCQPLFSHESTLGGQGCGLVVKHLPAYTGASNWTPHMAKPTNQQQTKVGREGSICGKPGMLPLCLQNMGLVTALVIAGCTAGILLGLPSKNPCTKYPGDPTPTVLSEEDNVGQKRKKIETSTPHPSLPPRCSTTQLAYILCL